MNKYEEKFKTTVGFTKNYIQNTSATLEEISNKMDVIEKTITSLQTAMAAFTHDTVVISALEKQIDAEKKNHQHWVTSQAYNLKSLYQYREKLAFLQELCPHEETKHDHFDYHKREDYYKCLLCGKVY